MILACAATAGLIHCRTAVTDERVEVEWSVAGLPPAYVERRWRAEVPWAAAWPFELPLSPSEHLPDLPSAREGARDLAAVLVDALSRLDQLFAASAPYMLWFHQRPTGGGAWPGAHLHAHVAPLWRAPGVVRHVAAGELGSGVFFNPVVPEEAAARLRDQPGTR